MAVVRANDSTRTRILALYCSFWITQSTKSYVIAFHLKRTQCSDQSDLKCTSFCADGTYTAEQREYWYESQTVQIKFLEQHPRQQRDDRGREQNKQHTFTLCARKAQT
jgi:hypothetical protein